jgi:hypothetical protein
MSLAFLELKFLKARLIKVMFHRHRSMVMLFLANPNKCSLSPLAYDMQYHWHHNFEILYLLARNANFHHRFYGILFGWGFGTAGLVPIMQHLTLRHCERRTNTS